MSPAAMRDRCPDCRAPRSLDGHINHGRLCPHVVYWRRDRREYPDLGEPPRPASQLSAAEAKDELLRMALAIEEGWRTAPERPPLRPTKFCS